MDSSDEMETEIIQSEEDDTDITPTKYNLLIYPIDFTLEILYQKMKKNDLTIPPIQRNFVWTPKQASNLIDSILMGLPIPAIFLYVQKDGTHLVIDGQQRLKTITCFIDGFLKYKDSKKDTRFKLSRLSSDHQWYNKGYDDFDDATKRKFNDYVLRATMIRQLEPKNEASSIYHIFERLNTGGTTLTDQEIRNCLFNGKLNTLLQSLNNYDKWRNIIGKTSLDNRQKDVGCVLRCISMLHNHNNYSKPMKDFLSQFMRNNQNPTDNFLTNEESRFKMTCDRIVEALGEKPFHPRHALSLPILDSVFVAFANHLDKPTGNLKQRFKKLLNNAEFQQSTHDATTDFKVIQARLKLADSILFG